MRHILFQVILFTQIIVLVFSNSDYHEYDLGNKKLLHDGYSKMEAYFKGGTRYDSEHSFNLNAGDCYDIVYLRVMVYSRPKPREVYLGIQKKKLHILFERTTKLKNRVKVAVHSRAKRTPACKNKVHNLGPVVKVRE